MYVYLCVCMCAYVYLCVYMCAYAYLCMHICVCVCISMYVYLCEPSICLLKLAEKKTPEYLIFQWCSTSHHFIPHNPSVVRWCLILSAYCDGGNNIATDFLLCYYVTYASCLQVGDKVLCISAQCSGLVRLVSKDDIYIRAPTIYPLNFHKVAVIYDTHFIVT